jgi:hypothetical protein
MGQISAEMTAYYLTINLIDWYVTSSWGDKAEEAKKKVIRILKWIEETSDINPADVGDANNCGKCENWDDVISGFAELFTSGERVPV